MPQVKGFKQGMFNWTDLSTTDVAGAKRFYGELFDWNFEDMPISEGHTYSMARRGGQEVGAVSELMAEQRQQGVPPHWMAYIWVSDLDATAKQVEPLGGKVVVPPFDVLDVGRMCVLQDPTGAIVSLWQEQAHKGAGLMNEPGALSWVELMTPNTGKAQDFYTKLLGWRPTTQQMGDMKYTSFMVGETPVGGMMTSPPGAPPSWMVYFATADCDSTVAKAAKLGGKTEVPPTDIPGVGRFSVQQDPQGAYYALIQFEP